MPNICQPGRLRAGRFHVRAEAEVVVASFDGHIDGPLGHALNAFHLVHLFAGEEAGVGDFDAIRDRFGVSDEVQAEDHIDVGAGAAHSAADRVPECDDVANFGLDAGLFHDFALDGEGQRLIVLGVAAGNLPAAREGVLAALHEQHLVVADDDAGAADREVAEVDVRAGRAGGALAAAVLFNSERHGTGRAVDGDRHGRQYRAASEREQT